MSGFANAALSRRALIGVAAIAAGLFVLAGLIAAIFGNPPSNDVIDVVGAIAWFGWMVAALVLVALCAAALIRRGLRTAPAGR
jgi:hypothetical protein